MKKTISRKIIVASIPAIFMAILLFTPNSANAQYYGYDSGYYNYNNYAYGSNYGYNNGCGHNGCGGNSWNNYGNDYYGHNYDCCSNYHYTIGYDYVQPVIYYSNPCCSNYSYGNYSYYNYGYNYTHGNYGYNYNHGNYNGGWR